ncbi:MAG: sigma-54-dependent Fis family transcriptional regulator [Acidobacteria bacterium]|nr:MAG: sigma-54-dependent Fis family transcriptional regulator [Acidobacteriota bacterium]
MIDLLLVDDQPAVLNALTILFEIQGYSCRSASSPDQALAIIASEEVGVVIQDMNFGRDKTSGEEGIELFRRIRSEDPDLPVLLLTGWTSLETAVALIKEGASDYLAKPWDDAKLVRSVENLLRIRRLQLENSRIYAARRQARKLLRQKYDLSGFIYESEQMHEVLTLAARIARADVPVLITGPSGSGKEKIAEIIQANSERRDRPFVRVNVGAIPDDLMESELFGAEPGAFTGSQKLRIGRFETADRGTLFLDEIGNLSAAGQMKLLRVLQSGEYERLGSSTTRRVDVRVISATNCDLGQAIREGRFREDLYFRLNVVELDVPPLGERSDDILPLAQHFLSEFSRAEEVPGLSFSREAQEALLRHSWPGNVREMRNSIQRGVLTRTRPVIEPADLGLKPRPASASPVTSTPASDAEDRTQVEEELIRAHGVVADAASQMGISRQALYRKMEKLGIVLERRPKA